MQNHLNIAIAQLSFRVGDIEGNKNKIINTLQQAHQQLQADICVCPELALCGYPPEDLLWNPDFKQKIKQAFQEILTASQQYPDVTLLFGFPEYVSEKIFNALAVVKNGEVITITHKQCLPHQGVFEELRYFTPGKDNKMFIANGIQCGLVICEDIWHEQPLAKLHQQTVDLAIVINASPYAIDKHRQRLQILQTAAEKTHTPLIYLNGMNAQDDLIFDGGSCCVNAQGEVIWQGEFYQENLYLLTVEKKSEKINIHTKCPNIVVPTDEALIYQALVMGLREYVSKNNLKGVIVGLSGGIDSALTLAIAVDALGVDRVLSVALPSRYTAPVSIDYAHMQAKTQGVAFKNINIDPLYAQFLISLTPHFNDLPADVTEENLQSRIRGTVLMSLANKYHYIVLCTSNKSESAVGFGTLYGDMIGAYAVLKDVLKTWVFRLARYRNTLDAVIPEAVIDRAPTAELALNQLDQDTLPPYPVLDEIIIRYVEQSQSVKTIIDAGFDETLVRSIIKKINQNEYKRRQSPPGPKVSACAFARERHYPITFFNEYTTRE